MVSNALQSNSCQDVAVIAVIKDESAYIHEWIHHYLYFGFKHIYLGINRTTDRTTEVLDLICSQYSNVKYFVMDWIDKDADKSGINPSMQRLSFSFLANEAFRDPNVSHCLSVDADEFFYPTDFKQDVSHFINSMPYNSRLSIHWACQEVDGRAFSAPFENKKYYTTPQVKTIMSREAFDNLRKFTLHVPLLKISDKSRHIDASGNIFKKGKHREISESNFNKDQKAFILHRMIRSETEYLALLLRKRPSSTLRVKDNRDGIIQRTKLFALEVNTEDLDAYYRSLDNFIVNCALTDTLTGIRNEIVSNSQEILNISDEDLLKDVDVYYKVLKGTSVFPTLHNRITSMKITTLKKASIDKLRDTALMLESYNMLISLELMQLALQFRPNGLYIKHKVSAYQGKLKQE
ncbi:glycosyltransferase family 2 protein [Psychromonas sp. 14N.309.X.WAT.B.A12]|uniref:glycosyltransferase family 2 protein n=1 Tax=Psychromonas sp. 14N.309.X.WAT.B.A12 TaxID=2998322 RepID=UPI0025B0DB04|nr:glycosyltransferase family 2 protein [Psychromonas sp. 14N.309.X.WAT.B.A12]MDN2664383.1 glycosyltransferase family 2 protein [Psychromonas sp. 14N.309.X.WAT.B.A12]